MPFFLMLLGVAEQNRRVAEKIEILQVEMGLTRAYWEREKRKAIESMRLGQSRMCPQTAKAVFGVGCSAAPKQQYEVVDSEWCGSFCQGRGCKFVKECWTKSEVLDEQKGEVIEKWEPYLTLEFQDLLQELEASTSNVC